MVPAALQELFVEVFHHLVHRKDMWDICLNAHGDFLMASTSSTQNNKQTNSGALVRQQTVPTE
jgi:hypothetical protein